MKAAPQNAHPSQPTPYEQLAARVYVLEALLAEYCHLHTPGGNGRFNRLTHVMSDALGGGTLTGWENAKLEAINAFTVMAADAPRLLRKLADDLADRQAAHRHDAPPSSRRAKSTPARSR